MEELKMANENIGTMVSATKEIDLTTFSLRKGNGPGGEYISTFVKSVEDGKSEYEEYLNIINSSRHFIKASTYIDGLIQVLILSTHKCGRFLNYKSHLYEKYKL